MEGSITSGDAHVAVNYDKLIQHGLKYFREMVEEYRAKLDLTDYRNLGKRYFYDAALIMIDSSVDFAHRFADLAAQMAEEEQDEKRKKSFWKSHVSAGEFRRSRRKICGRRSRASGLST